MLHSEFVGRRNIPETTSIDFQNIRLTALGKKSANLDDDILHLVLYVLIEAKRFNELRHFFCEKTQAPYSTDR
jgi:hypothetical protein